MEKINQRCATPKKNDDMIKFAQQFLGQLADAIVQASANDEDEQIMDTIIHETL